MNINSVIANLGNGNITTGDITTGDIHQKNNVNNANHDEFLKILKELKCEIEKLNDSSAKEAIELIQEETKKESWNKKLIKFALDTVQKVGVTLAAKGVITLGSKAMALLPLI